jgi:hypothetical protein
MPSLHHLPARLRRPAWVLRLVPAAKPRPSAYSHHGRTVRDGDPAGRLTCLVTLPLVLVALACTEDERLVPTDPNEKVTGRANTLASGTPVVLRGTVVTPEGVIKHGYVSILNGRIGSVSERQPDISEALKVNVDGIISPGFVATPSTSELQKQPAPCLCPISLYCTGGHPQCFRGLLLRKATEVAAFDDLVQPRVQRRQPPERLVQSEQGLTAFVRRRIIVPQRPRAYPATSSDRLISPGVVDQDTPHRPCS